MDDLLGSFPSKCASEDKERWKYSCCFVGPVVIPRCSHNDVERYKWYQSLDPARSVADRDIVPVRGGDCDSQNPVIHKGKDRVRCGIPHRLGKVKCDDSKTV